MYYLELYEKWFFNKKKGYNIDIVQDEPIDVSKIDIYRDNINNDIKLMGRYRLAFIANRNNNKSIYYLEKFIGILHSLSINLYKYFRLLYRDNDIDVVKNDKLFNKAYKKLSFRFGTIVLFDDNRLHNYMNDIEYFLNRISSVVDDNLKKVRFYKVVDGKFTVYYDRIKVEKQKEEHKDVDPFGEEDWN